MTDSGLSDRLRQKSRRAGLAVGLSMALTIAICIGGATVIYAALIGPLNQFIPVLPALQAPAAGQGAGGGAGLSDNSDLDAPDEPAQSSQAIAAAPTQAPPPEPAPAPAPTPSPEPTLEAETFEPTHQITASQSVNLRPRPSRASEPGNEPITALPPSTPLQYLDEDAPADNPDDAPGWMRFRTEEGLEGWVREIDIAPYEP